MKNRFLVLVCVAACGVWLGGCKKSANPSAPGGGANGSSSAGNAAGGTLLKVKWQPGKRYVNSVTNSQIAEINVPGMASPLKQEVSLGQQFAVTVNKTLDDGGSELGMEFLSYHMDQTTGGRRAIAFDSSDDPSKDGRNPVAPIFRKIVGAKLVFTVDADGKVVGVEGVDDLIASIRQGASPQVSAMIDSMISEDQFKRYLDAGQAMPNHAVNVGDTWPIDFEMRIAAVGKLKLHLDCKYTGMEQHGDRNCARIDYTGTMTSKAAAGAESTPVSAEIQKGKLTGTSWFDPDLGMVVDNNGEQTFAAKINANGQKLTANFTQDTAAKLVEVTDAPK